MALVAFGTVDRTRTTYGTYGIHWNTTHTKHKHTLQTMKHTTGKTRSARLTANTTNKWVIVNPSIDRTSAQLNDL